MRKVFIPTVRIDPAIDKALRATAARQGETVSDIVRSALSYYLAHPAARTTPSESPAPKLRFRAQP